jgi:hypothetical protein
MVRLAHFHLARRDNPQCAVQIELAPFGMAQFTGADKYMGRNLQGQLGNAAAFIVIDGAQQLATWLASVIAP